MAYVNIELVMDYLSSDMRAALENAVERTAPGARIDAYNLFFEFRHAVSQKCLTWQEVPDEYVRLE